MTFGDIPLPELVAQVHEPHLKSCQKKISTLLNNVLKFPTVGSKKFLVTIGDRTVNGLVYRDQLIGNKQMPVSDYAATLDNYDSYSGQVISVGEKPNLAIENPEASSRMALAKLLLIYVELSTKI